MNLKPLQESLIKQLSHTQSTDDFLDYLMPCGDLSAEQQLAIYQNNVRGALQKTLALTYSVCCKILGENYFKQLARMYIKNHPSRHYDLNGYGEFFADFLQIQCQQQSELQNFPYLSDLAKLEWLYQQIYYAADAGKFDFTAFAELTDQQQVQSQFQLTPCLQFMCSDYPVLSIWQVNQLESNQQQTLSSQVENICIFREDNQIQLILIDSQTLALLTLIKQHSSLDIISKTGYGNLLAELIQRGWIDGFKVNHV